MRLILIHVSHLCHISPLEEIRRSLLLLASFHPFFLITSGRRKIRFLLNLLLIPTDVVPLQGLILFVITAKVVHKPGHIQQARWLGRAFSLSLFQPVWLALAAVDLEALGGPEELPG
ncbi:hypothetical protein M5K25_028096 [Dendrobium thyrsiflorum]|uniref:Uncharacterized protein n=1 Tax=Dendrobium thyrsiflorum TaxID=117978 RepID=A0ABD0TVP1_DENTH